MDTNNNFYKNDDKNNETNEANEANEINNIDENEITYDNNIFNGSMYINRNEYIIYMKMIIYGLIFYLLNTVEINKYFNKEIENIFINIIIFIIIVYLVEKVVI